MTVVILVHGAFRGGWAWAPVVDCLADRGVRAVAPDLPNAGEDFQPDHDVVDLPMATAALRELVLEVGETVALVGHSQGALVVRNLLGDPGVCDLIEAVGYLDGAVPDDGERAVDLKGGLAGGGTQEVPIEVRTALIDPPPPDGCLPRALRSTIRDRTTPQHAAIAFDPVGPSVYGGPVAWAFASDTPDTYPSAVVRARLERRGTPFEVLDGCHDLALQRPEVVAEWIVGRVLTR